VRDKEALGRGEIAPRKTHIIPRCPSTSSPGLYLDELPTETKTPRVVQGWPKELRESSSRATHEPKHGLGYGNLDGLRPASDGKQCTAWEETVPLLDAFGRARGRGGLSRPVVAIIGWLHLGPDLRPFPASGALTQLIPQTRRPAAALAPSWLVSAPPCASDVVEATRSLSAST